MKRPKIAILAQFPLSYIHSEGVEPKGYHCVWLIVLHQLLRSVCDYDFHWIVPDKGIRTASVVEFSNQTFHLLPKARSPKWKASIALSLVLVMGISLVHALPDLYDCYAMAQDREMQVTQAVENGETALTTFGIESRSSYDGFHQLHDLTIDPNAMENIYYARYHGLDAIVIDRVE